MLKIGQFANNDVRKKYFSLNLEMFVIILFVANLFKIPINWLEANQCKHCNVWQAIWQLIDSLPRIKTLSLTVKMAPINLHWPTLSRDQVRHNRAGALISVRLPRGKHFPFLQLFYLWLILLLTILGLKSNNKTTTVTIKKKPIWNHSTSVVACSIGGGGGGPPHFESATVSHKMFEKR